MFAASKTGAPVTAKDPQFKYVTMLLHGDGTNGAQNNTFLDSSTNNFTITRNGNTTQGTFTPYGANWSNYFNASASRLEVVNSNSSMIAQGTAFTLECWTFINTNTATGNAYNTSMPLVCSSPNSTSVSNGRLYSFGTTTFGFWDRASASWLTISWTPPVGQWFHLALVSTGTVFTLYINGTSVGSVTDNTTYYADSGYNFYIASYVGNGTAGSPPIPNMYISNFRYTKAQVYTSSFTPSTSPLTAITNTTVLTCQSNRFIDNSTNAYAVNPLGTTTPSVQRFSPFSPTSAYSTSVIGGSGYFDGSGDYLNTTSTQVIPSGSFTVEAWVYPTSSADSYFVAQGTTGNVGRFSIGITSGSWYVQIGATNINTSTVVLNQWTYVAATFNGTTLTLYVNGTSVGTGATVVNAQNTTLRVGSLGPADWGTFYWTGYIGPVRISNTVRTISAPTTPYSSDGNTTCLLSYTNAGILDNAMMNDLETVGNAQISTSVKKYGTGSLAFDGTDDRLTAASSPNMAFGTGDFTIEGWFYINSGSGTNNGALQISGTTGGLQANQTTNIAIYSADSSGTKWGAYYANTFAYGSASTTQTWTHIALVRSSGSLKLYVNGTADATFGTKTDTTNYTGQNICVGGYYSTLYLWNGYIDDLRITKGYARYTSNFTAPTAAFPNN